MTKKKIVFLLIITVFPRVLSGQEIPHPVNNTGVYEFLDELAGLRLISINSAVKPYSRLYIAGRLEEADGMRDALNQRQRKELDFYLLDFGKELEARKNIKLRRDLFYYRDSLFSLTVNPILGGEVFLNSSGKATYWRNGAEARGYAGKWGFYASLRDNHEKPVLGKPGFLTSREGGHIKGSTDWSEMQGGVTYSWKWGYAGLIKEKQQWGNNYNGANIFGGNNPTFVQFRLQIAPVKWFNFNYFHGWLNSKVVDSADSYFVKNSYGTDYREVYHKKYIAANMFTFTPLRYLNVSVGNSIVYSDENINPAYIIPVFFYKSVDHSLTSGIDNMNSQMYADISSRQIKHFHLYTTLFVDELSVARFGKDDEWNFLSWKAGFNLTDLPFSNLSLTAEYTYTYPLTFQHYVPTLTFENAGFNLGHYMKDNSRELYIALIYRPLRTLNVKAYYLDAVRGPDYTAAGTSRLGNPPLENIVWQNTTYGLCIEYQVINDVYVRGSGFISNIAGEPGWSPVFFQGEKRNLNIGVSVGF
ncbi:MAG TPA: hypothetical protein VHO46_01975 [Bacteroidales bacterium]|nr:hypothetical protein [Bacteroidales bacterium]